MLNTRASIVAVVIVLAACSDGTSVTSPSRALTPALNADKGGSSNGVDHSNVTQRVDGDISFLLAPNAWELISEHAVKHAKNGFDGQFLIQGPNYRLSGPVFCFNVVGNTVRVSGLVARSSTTDVPPGRYVVWSQQDNDVHVTNGEAAGKQPPDQSSHFYVMFTQFDAQWHCDVGINVNTMFSATHGKVEVYPEP